MFALRDDTKHIPHLVPSMLVELDGPFCCAVSTNANVSDLTARYHHPLTERSKNRLTVCNL